MYVGYLGENYFRVIQSRRGGVGGVSMYVGEGGNGRVYRVLVEHTRETGDLEVIGKDERKYRESKVNFTLKETTNPLTGIEV